MKVSTALATVAGVCAAALVPAGPAIAAESDCTAYKEVICLAEHGNWTGRIWRQTAGQINQCRSMVPDGFNDMASAWTNRTTGFYVIFYEHANCSGRTVGVGQGEKMVSGAADNDMISAVRIIPA